MDYATYEEYLDAQISETDLFYLEDEDLARQPVELGYRGAGDTLKRDEFEARKRALAERGQKKAVESARLVSAEKDLSQYPVLLALQKREELIRAGKLTSTQSLLATHFYKNCTTGPRASELSIHAGNQNSTLPTRQERQGAGGFRVHRRGAASALRRLRAVLHSRKALTPTAYGPELLQLGDTGEQQHLDSNVPGYLRPRNRPTFQEQARQEGH